MAKAANTYTMNGETKSLFAWAKQYGTHVGTVYSRMQNGYTLEEALTAPTRGPGRKVVDQTGRRFGIMTALELVGRDRYNRPVWRCRCDCGKLRDLSGRQLYGAYSCGCSRRPSAATPKPEKAHCQPCWHCKNYAGGCSWSRKDAKPVEGWEAIRSLRSQGSHPPLETYFILHCPEYIPDGTEDRI